MFRHRPINPLSQSDPGLSLPDRNSYRVYLGISHLLYRPLLSDLVPVTSDPSGVPWTVGGDGVVSTPDHPGDYCGDR